MTITTASGKSFDCDLAVTTANPSRLFLHLPNTQVQDAAVFTDEKELPLEDYQGYTGFDSLSIAPDGGVNICLK